MNASSRRILQASDPHCDIPPDLTSDEAGIARRIIEAREFPSSADVARSNTLFSLFVRAAVAGLALGWVATQMMTGIAVAKQTAPESMKVEATTPATVRQPVPSILQPPAYCLWVRQDGPSLPACMFPGVGQ